MQESYAQLAQKKQDEATQLHLRLKELQEKLSKVQGEQHAKDTEVMKKRDQVTQL